VRAALVVAVLAVAPAASAEIFGSSFRSAAWGVELTVPRGWELSEQRSYPGILVRGLERRGGGRLTLAAERLAPGDDLGKLVERNQRILRKLRYRYASSTHSGGAVLLDATTPDRKRTVRQAYLAQNGVAYVLSMASSTEAASRYLHPFDDVLRSLSFSAPSVVESP
jgi:hypothetical protein